jgi:hypothetical protein
MRNCAKILKFATIYSKAATVSTMQQTSHPKGEELPLSFWIKFVQMAQRLSVDPKDLGAVIYRESSFDPSAGSPDSAQGLNQMIKSTAIDAFDMTPETWAEYGTWSAEEQLPWVEKYFSKMNIQGKNVGQIYRANLGGYNNPDGSYYASYEAQAAYKAQHPNAVFKGPEDQDLAVEKNRPLADESGRITPASLQRWVMQGAPGKGSGIPSYINQKIDEAIRAIGDTSPPPAPTPRQSSERGQVPQQSVPGTNVPPAQPPAELPGMGQQDVGGIESMIWFQ